MTIDQIADAIFDKVQQSKVQISRDKILAWLHYSTDGQSLVKGLTRPGISSLATLRRDLALKTFAAEHGVRAICKHIISENNEAASAFTEEEFTQILMDDARKSQRTGESIGSAFSRTFSSDTADGLLMRKAHAKVKEANCPSLTVGKAHLPSPTQVGGKDATDVSTDGSKAYQQLAAMAEQLRASSPYMTFAQAFARVYTQPENAELAEAERRGNRPRANNDPYQR
jgi:hypothetical protein